MIRGEKLKIRAKHTSLLGAYKVVIVNPFSVFIHMAKQNVHWAKLLGPVVRAIHHHDSPKQCTKTILQLIFAPV